MDDINSSYIFRDRQHDLIATSIKARRAGLSYGQYVWQQNQPQTVFKLCANAAEPKKRKPRTGTRKAKPVYQWSPEGEFLRAYASCADAAEAIGSDASADNIRSSAKGVRERAYGYVWSFLPRFPLREEAG